MPAPNRRPDPSPKELARQIADQLARSKPATTRFSLRNSVLVGRFVAGVTMLVSVAVVGAGLVAGANWLLAQTKGPQAEVLAKTVTLDDVGESADITTTTGFGGLLVPLDPLMFPTPFVDNGDAAAGSGTTAVTIPAATTASTPATSSSVASSTSMPTTTTVQATTSSSSSIATTAPPTTTTVPEPSTTAMPSTTTTVEPTTTTTSATTTTTEGTTTTSRPSPPSTPGQGG